METHRQQKESQTEGTGRLGRCEQDLFRTTYSLPNSPAILSSMSLLLTLLFSPGITIHLWSLTYPWSSSKGGPSLGPLVVFHSNLQAFWPLCIPPPSQPPFQGSIPVDSPSWTLACEFFESRDLFLIMSVSHVMSDRECLCNWIGLEWGWIELRIRSLFPTAPIMEMSLWCWCWSCSSLGLIRPESEMPQAAPKTPNYSAPLSFQPSESLQGHVPWTGSTSGHFKANPGQMGHSVISMC